MAWKTGADGWYDAVAVQDRRWWTILVPEIDGVTQARHRNQIEQAAKELIAVTLDVPPDDVLVSVTFSVDPFQ